MLSDDFPSTVDCLLGFLGDIRGCMRRHCRPARLELLQGRREHGIERTMAVLLDRGGCGRDFGVQVLDFALLRQE